LLKWLNNEIRNTGTEIQKTFDAFEFSQIT